VAVGSVLGAKASGRIGTGWLVALFVVVMAYVSVQMAMRAFGAA
jgi:uncharacterized membrane protein YfcA